MPVRWLLIEIGNTHAKFAVGSGELIGKRRLRIPTRDFTAATLAGACARIRFDRAILCSVVPRASRVVRRQLGPGLIEVSASSKLDFSLAGYRRAETIGADRLANLAGALAAGIKPPFVAVDAGTATTFDVLDRDLVYRGGVIAPGSSMFTDYLHARAAQLPLVKANPRRPPSILGKSTRAAIAAAAVHGFRGMVRGIFSEIKAALGVSTLQIVASGGAADWIGTGKAVRMTRDHDLTLRGMLAIARRNA